MSRPLDDYAVPITSGSAPTGRTDALSPERSAALALQLRELADARACAAAEIRTYVIRGVR